ncbi:endo-1,4-beta-xylanase [Winogradskyella sp.]|nr:endo-1,4-beta-xylanase [Winogradskyella sp.]MDB4752526.1 endo-1,4-beta-xylanase [Winogradskyella sp.]
MKKFKYITVIIIIYSVFCCAQKKQINAPVKESLADHFEGLFYVGAALNEDTILDLDNKSKAIVSKEFNSISPENSLKWMFVQPEHNQFNFKVADDYVKYGIENNMYVVGHALIWHSQLSEFVSSIEDKNKFYQVVENHINKLVSRYKNKIDAWDVVNEAFNEDGTLRESVFFNNMGKNYIQEVFKLASQADPNADLIYNDYNLYKTEKRKAILKMVQSIKSKGVKISGIGVQAHWDLNSPSIKEIEQIILDISNIGCSVSFTELDISVLPSPWELVGAEVNQNFTQFEGDKRMNPYPKDLPEFLSIKLAKRYQDIFNLFVKHKDKISRVTFWGVSDKHSWLNDWPIKGRTNYPLLFDKNYQTKQAYKSLIEIKTKLQ